MIRAGKLCKQCSNKCRNLPTEAQPRYIECPCCDGRGECEHCDDGHVLIPGCPTRYCDEIVPAVELIDLFHEGMPPVDGGALDQSDWFLNAARFLKNEDALIRAEMK